MALKPVVIQLEATGGGEVQATINGVAVSLGTIGDAAQDAAGGINQASQAANNMSGRGPSEVADAMGDAGDAASGAAKQFDAATARLEAMHAGAERMQAVGDKLKNIGAAGLELSANLASVAEEGNAIEQRLESILKAQGRAGELDAQNEIVQDVTVRGHFDDDDPLREATVLLDSFSVSTEHMSILLEDAARQARTMGTDVQSVAQQLGAAYNSGDVGGLKESGVTVSDEDIERIKEAYELSTKLGQQKFVEILSPAIRANTVALEDSLTATQAAANDAARALDDFQTNIGTGSANAQANVTALGGELLGLIALSPEQQEAAGGLLFYGSYALQAIGSVLSLGGQVAAMAIQWKLAKGVQAIASLEAGAAATVEAGAVGTAGAASAAGGAAAGVGSVGFGALAVSIWAAVAPLLILVAVALAAAAAIYALDKAMNAQEDADLAKNLDVGEQKDREFYDKQLERRKAGKSSVVNAGESYDDYRRRMGRGQEDSELENVGDRRSHGGPDGDSSGGAVDMNALQKMITDAKAGGGASGAAQVPTIGGAAVPVSGMSAIGAAGASVTNAQTGAVAEAQADVDQLTAEIQQLQDAKRSAKKKEKEAIQEQIILKQRDLKRAREELKAAKEQDKDAQKRADKAAKSANDIEKIEAGAGIDGEIAALQTQLDAAKEAKDSKRVESLTLQIAMAKAARDRDAALMDAALILDADERDAATRTAKARFEATRQAATRDAAKAGKDVFDARTKELMAIEDRGETRLQKIDLKGKFAEQIGDLEDKLSEARDAKDAAQIEALTLQIDMAKAEQSRQEALIDAAGIKDRVERGYTLDAIKAEFDNAASAARRAARRARRDAEKTDEKGQGKDGQSIHDAAIRSQLAMMRSGQFAAPVNALGSGINYGDRFAEADALRPDYAAAMAPMDWSAMNRRSEQRNGSNPQRSGGGKRSAEFEVEAESYRQNGRGEIEVTLKGGVITIPNQGIGQLRGRTRRR